MWKLFFFFLVFLLFVTYTVRNFPLFLWVFLSLFYVWIILPFLKPIWYVCGCCFKWNVLQTHTQTHIQISYNIFTLIYYRNDLFFIFLLYTFSLIYRHFMQNILKDKRKEEKQNNKTFYFMPSSTTTTNSLNFSFLFYHTRIYYVRTPHKFTKVTGYARVKHDKNFLCAKSLTVK